MSGAVIKEKATLGDVNEEATTPLLAQYLALKAQHQDALLFFRLGDFYELFFEDAVAAARALDIALTHRGQVQGKDVPMCGVPFHAYENYLARLIRKGFRVAICEQMEDPAEAKKRGAKSIVARDVVRIVTPGTVTEDSLLDKRRANYLACLAGAGGHLALAWMDLAAATPFVAPIELNELGSLLARVGPSELLVADALIDHADLAEVKSDWRSVLTTLPSARFDSENARRRLCATYHVETLDSFGTFERAEVAALGALLDYVALTQKTESGKFLPPQKNAEVCAILDGATQRNLEIVRTQTGERTGSLLEAVDRTQTGAGSRLLATRLLAPLTDCAAIGRRLDAVSFGIKESAARDKIVALLKETPDLERALARLALGRGGPRDLAAVREALTQAARIRSLLLACMERGAEIDENLKDLGEFSRLCDRLARALAEDLPLLARDGGFIAKGFSEALDEKIILRDDSRRLIAEMQQGYAEQAGVSALKIKHNLVIGYYIEVTPQHADKMLAMKDTFIHRQSLASAVRFTTVELSELDRKISEAAESAIRIELQLFEGLVGDVLAVLGDLRGCARALAALDVATSLAVLAEEEHYARPVVDASCAFEIKGGRHPVVEQMLRRAGGESFIGNDCALSEGKRLWLLTGPNMAGKSTFLRQNALIALLAQVGSFVPAAAAHIGIVDRFFSRVGAADDLARGRSTFMVEMVETAAILNQATARSLVILDEIGRGTATFDGLSIAWSVVEHLHDICQCRSLFATHYHELTALAGRLPTLFCATMKIKEWKQEVVFMHEVVAGTADRSYGLHVAAMAGLPQPVLARAGQVLALLEKDGGGSKKKVIEDLPLFAQAAVAPEPEGQRVDAALWQTMLSVAPDEMTPKEALDWVYRLKEMIKENAH